MWKILTLILFLILILTGLNFYKKTPKTILPPQNSPTSSTELPPTEVIAKNLAVPWALAFLPVSPADGPDNSILVTERGGKVKIIKDGKIKEIAKIDVKQTGESGLHGIAIDPNFSDNHNIYLYYTYSAENNSTKNRVSRFRFENDLLSDEQTIVDNIPGAIFHDGGRIKFGPDKFLYITTGDALNPSLAQDQNALAGKILRYKDDKVEVYSYGHRNPQGITWDSEGNLWEVEHGQTATDEVNKITQGKNYGWPIIRGDETKPGMENPIEHSDSITWAPAGLAFYNESFFFGGLRGQALYELRVDGEYPDLKEHFKGQFGRIRDVILGPDNFIYITTSNRDGRGTASSEDDKIIRINPEKL